MVSSIVFTIYFFFLEYIKAHEGTSSQTLLRALKVCW